MAVIHRQRAVGFVLLALLVGGSLFLLADPSLVRTPAGNPSQTTPQAYQETFLEVLSTINAVTGRTSGLVGLVDPDPLTRAALKGEAVEAGRIFGELQARLEALEPVPEQYRESQRALKRALESYQAGMKLLADNVERGDPNPMDAAFLGRMQEAGKNVHQAIDRVLSP